MDASTRRLILLLLAGVVGLASCRCRPQPVPAARRPAGAASVPRTLSLLTYNVLADADPADRRTSALLKLLGDSRADVIALQEVAPWFLARLQAAAWVRPYHATTFGGRVAAPGGQLVLSRHPIERSLARMLPGPQRRTVVVAVIRLAPGRRVAVATAHMESFLEDGPVRARQLERIFALVAGYDGAVVLGDFNFGDGEQPETGRLDRRYTDLWLALHPGEPGYTWDMERSIMARRGSFAGEQSRRLDRILVRLEGYRPSAVRIIGQWPVQPGGEIFPSDHFGLVGTLARQP